MRATVNIPDELMREVQRISGEKSRTKAIVTAMEAFVKQKKMEALLELRGKIQIDYDWEREENQEIALQEERERYHES